MTKKENKIPKDQYYYHVEAKIPYITYELFKKFHSKSDLEQFQKWMYGQTCMLIEDGAIDVVCVYTWDYERWLRQGKQAEQDPEDWD
jgi:hypothetical protein